MGANSESLDGETNNAHRPRLSSQRCRIIKSLLRLWEDEHGVTPETVVALFEDVFGGLFAGVDDKFAAVEGGDQVY
jgi:hypothetical protein